MVLGAGAFAFLGFVALAVYAALVAGSRADDEMDRLRWGEDEDGYPPVGV